MRLREIPACLRVKAAAPELTHASSLLTRAPKKYGSHSALLLIMLVAATGMLARAQQYKSIVVFGDSLSDTGNVTDLTLAKYGVPVPGPVPPLSDYTFGRFTDGYDTLPAAIKYNGVWVEQLAGMLPTRPVIKASLNGGTDYAYGYARTGGGTSEFTLGDTSDFVVIDNVGQQISTYLGTHPKINSNTLYIVWAGAIDVLYANSPQSVVDAALDEAGDVQRLIQAGAKHILVPNLPPLGSIPRLMNMPSEAATATEGSVLFNDTLGAALDVEQFFAGWEGAHIYQLNVFSLFKSVIASPGTYFLQDVKDSSQGVLTADPDEYLFWDDLHPTTHGHDILALAALKLIDPYECEIQSGPWMQPSCAAVP